LSGHTSQSCLLARYSRVLPSCTVPLIPSCNQHSDHQLRVDR
jgi:hypothetical protein